jgi:hypothetical protein
MRLQDVAAHSVGPGCGLPIVPNEAVGLTPMLLSAMISVEIPGGPEKYNCHSLRGREIQPSKASSFEVEIGDSRFFLRP